MLTWLLAGLGIGVWYIQKFKDWIYSDRFHLYFFICVSLAIIALIALYQAQKIIDGLVRLTFRFSGEPPRYSLVESKGRNLFEVGAAVLVNNSGDQTIKAKFSIKILIRKRIGWKSFEVKNTIQDAYGRYWQPEQKKEIPPKDENLVPLSFRIEDVEPFSGKLKLMITMKVVGQEPSTIKTTLLPAANRPSLSPIDPTHSKASE